jgi:release factor glutamine methyltransferase
MLADPGSIAGPARARMNPDSAAALIATATRALSGEQARAEAELLLAEAIGKNRAWLYSHADDRVPDAARRRFAEWVERRRIGEPVAQILGRQEFWSLSMSVTSDTLIPRPETELLVELALQRIPADAAWDVLDLGTGSGAVALALAHERTRARITAIDRDARTLAVAQRNGARLAPDRVRFLRGDWFSPVADEQFDLIVSNPPYIAQDDPHLQQGDLRFEPRAALASGRDGLDAIRIIVASAAARLRPGAWLLLEHGFEQGEATRGLLHAAGFESVETYPDLESRDRVSGGRRPS